MIISNLSFGYENYKVYEGFQDVYIIRLDNFKDGDFNRYLFIFKKSDGKLLITKLCIKELIINEIEYKICNENRIKM